MHSTYREHHQMWIWRYARGHIENSEWIRVQCGRSSIAAGAAAATGVRGSRQVECRLRWWHGKREKERQPKRYLKIQYAWISDAQNTTNCRKCILLALLYNFFLPRSVVVVVVVFFSFTIYYVLLQRSKKSCLIRLKSVYIKVPSLFMPSSSIFLYLTSFECIWMYLSLNADCMGKVSP